MSTNNNICQVQQEDDFDEILKDRSNTLTIVMYSSKTCAPCMNFKQTFVSIAKDNPDCYFVYIDINNFTQSQYKYLKNVNGTPKFSYYFNGHNMAEVLGADKNTFIQTMVFLKQKIRERDQMIQRDAVLNQQLQQQQQQAKPSTVNSNASTSASASTKIDLLQKLYDLTQQGVVLTQSYSTDSNVDQMQMEYTLQCNLKKIQDNKQNTPEVLQVPPVLATPQVQNPQLLQNPQINLNLTQPTNQISQDLIHQNELIKKHEQLKKIQELNQIQNIVQRQNIIKLNQLKEFQRRKEQEERDRRNNNSN